MTICLIPNCSAALEKVDSGLYAAAGEVVREALRRLFELDAEARAP
jgi:Arc/MetJ-type ribon-helix-helix transcriptional regulator